MPPGRTPPQRTFNTSLLETEALAAPGGLRTALSSIESVCYSDDSSIMEMVVELSNRPHTLEYIFSSTFRIFVFPVGLTEQTTAAALDDQAYERLSKWTVARFPTPATPDVMGALGIKLLQRLSSSLVSVEGVSTQEYRNELREFRKEVGLSLNVLEELDGYADPALVNVHLSPVSRKRPKAPARRTQLDPHSFDCMGIAVPTTEDEVRVVFGKVLSRLQSILEVRASLSFPLPRNTHPTSALPPRSEATSDIGYIQTSIRRPRDHRVHNSVNQSRPVSRRREGVWGVADFALSQGAKVPARSQTWKWRYVQDRHEENKVSNALSACRAHFTTRSRELSHGHFSDDNHKKLTGTKTIIPVYEAKMTGDTRLVVSRGVPPLAERTNLPLVPHRLYPQWQGESFANIHGFTLTSTVRAKPKVIISLSFLGVP